MARTMGAAVPRGGADGDRTRPTTSVRRERVRQTGEEVVGFPGGPSDLSVLRRYGEHVAVKIWEGEDRKPLKVVSHGSKLKKIVDADQFISDVVEGSGLAPLLHCSQNTIDRGLVSAFAERWHKETSSFHLPVGEMTVTLDDVSSLLHIPVRGELVDVPTLGKDLAVQLLQELLGVTLVEAAMECEQTRTGSVRFKWLGDVFQRCIDDGQLEHAARAFLLRVVGCTLFADKSSTSVSVSYLELFRDLQTVGRFAWGAAALAYLYEHLTDASFPNTKQIGGYMTLLQSWILEHFPMIAARAVNDDYLPEQPMCMRLSVLRSSGDIRPYRELLDRIHTRDVSWTPYAEHRQVRPLDDICLYSGYIRCGGIICLHLPERVLRQFGHIQSIPHSPFHRFPQDPSIEAVDDAFSRFEEYLVPAAVRGPTSSHPKCHPGYMDWFMSISHPYMIPSSVRRISGSSGADRPSGSQTMPLEDSDRHQEDMDRLVHIFQSVLDTGRLPPGTPEYDMLQEGMTIATTYADRIVTYQRRKRGRPSTSAMI